MGKDVSSGKLSPSPEPIRHVYGPRTLAALLPPITRPAFRARSPAATQLMTDWQALVGPQTAAMAHPRRFAGGTLTLAVAGPAALELQHLAPQLIARINAGVGHALVERLRFVQDDAIPFGPVLSPRTPEPRPVQVEDMAEGPLRDALARLGGRIADKDRS
jgi:hypothetical protein